MEQSSNKTIMCSVFFLDIVGYSKRSVAGQISLKERFNSYLSAAIRDVPLSDRIILDTGDGAAINFMGDIEDALKAALSMRSSMLLEDPTMEPPLLVRMGINLGPVRLIRDINGLPNIVGDGINVAQRVMGFADASQILVSRSYFDAVSRLSPQYAGMFHYQGSRTDKHVREHEVYAIGYPGDKSTRPIMVQDGMEVYSGRFAKIVRLFAPVSAAWYRMLRKFEATLELAWVKYHNIDERKRPYYVAALGVPVVLLFAFGLKVVLRENEMPVKPKPVIARVPRMLLAASGVPMVSGVPATSGVLAVGLTGASAVSGVPVMADPGTVAQQGRKSTLPSATAIRKKVVRSKIPEMPKQQPRPMTDKERADRQANRAINKLFGFAKGGESNNAKLSLSCYQGTLLFVDGIQRGRVVSEDPVIDVYPGRHVVIVILPNQKLFTQSVDVPAGKMLKIRPLICR